MCSPDALTSAASVCKPLRPSKVTFSRVHDKACAIGRSGLCTRRPQVPQPYQLFELRDGLERSGFASTPDAVPPHPRLHQRTQCSWKRRARRHRHNLTDGLCSKSASSILQTFVAYFRTRRQSLAILHWFTAPPPPMPTCCKALPVWGSGQPDGPSTHGHCYWILISWNLGHCACDCDCAVPLTSKARLLTSNCTLNACMCCLDLGIMSVSVTLNEPMEQ